MGFGQGVSGINAAAANLDVIGNNIANANTVGYKQSTAQFADVYAGTKIGLGTSVNAVVQSFSGGNIESSGNSLDVAITNGNGFYRLVDSSGAIFYSRNGQFQKQNDGTITNAAGLKLTGYPAGVVAGGGVQPQPLVISNAQMQPKATTSVSAQFNLNSGSTVPATAFTSAPGALPTSGMFNYSTGITTYDSLGNAQQLTAYFSKQAAGPGTTAGGSDWQMNLTDSAGNLVGGGPFAMQFSSSGVLTSPTTATAPTFTLPAANGAAAMAVKLDLTGTTQFGAGNDTKSLTQNGYTSGSLLGFAVQPNGSVLGSYSNQQTQSLGQVVLANFGNVQGLQSQGGNVWSATGSSGQELLSSPGGSAGTLKSNATEASNVDLSGQLVNLIVAQRNYQANAQTIKAQDQVMQTLVNL